MTGLDALVKSQLSRKGFLDNPSSDLKFIQKHKYKQQPGQEISLYSEVSGKFLPALQTENSALVSINLKLVDEDEVIQDVTGQGPDRFTAAEEATGQVKSIKKLMKKYGVCL